jgi:hypothetical protein
MIALFTRLATPAPARMRTRAVEVFADRFVLNGVAVRWDAVTRVRACKLARFAWDEICLEIGADSLAVPLRLREHEKGFDDFVAMADRRMNFPLAWWSGLERGGVLLFERHRGS